jgi:hypothetical protein
MKDNFDPIIRRTQRYWYVDGLAEITVGLIFVLLNLFFLANAWLVPALARDASLSPVLAMTGLLAITALVVWLFRQGLQTAKARLTYPRTGYVASPRHWKGSFWQRYGIMAWLVVVCLALLVLTFNSQTPPSWAPLLTGSAAGLTVLFLGYRFQLARFALLACALVAIGAIVTYLNPGEPLAETLSSLAGGACFLISGGLTLVHYLHSTQAPSTAEQADHPWTDSDEE